MDENFVIAELTKHDQKLISHDHEIRDIKNRQDNVDEMVRAVAALGAEQEAVKKDVSEIKADVKSIKEKPGKRWESVIDHIVFVIIGAIVGYILVRLGLST